MLVITTNSCYIKQYEIENIQPINDPILFGVIKLAINSTPGMQLRNTGVAVPAEPKRKTK
jgi:hypothetical protein